MVGFELKLTLYIVNTFTKERELLQIKKKKKLYINL